MDRFSVVQRRAFDIYGLRVEMGFASMEEAGEVSRLLGLFVRERGGEVDLSFNYAKREKAKEIGTFLLPLLARRGIWSMHAGGFHFEGGLLVVGPSGSGKSTFSHLALENGLSIVSDDITLLREKGEAIELLPFYSVVCVREGDISPDIGRFGAGSLRAILFPRLVKGRVEVRRVKGRGEVTRRLVTGLLWSYEIEIRERQKEFLERMSTYPAFEVDWNLGIFDNPGTFERILDETLQG